MRRRTFIAALGGAAVWPLAGHAALFTGDKPSMEYEEKKRCAS